MGEEVKPCNLPLGATYSEPQWISNKPVPAVGDIVNVRVNSIGKCKVLKYFVEHNFLGLFVNGLDSVELLQTIVVLFIKPIIGIEKDQMDNETIVKTWIMEMFFDA